MGILLPFKPQSPPKLFELFNQEEIEEYRDFYEKSCSWVDKVRPNTLYPGYPSEAPNHAHHPRLIWYVNEKRKFGTWLLNLSPLPIEESKELRFGWSPFARKSTAPPHEPLNITQKEIRDHIVWFVDEDGYGQYDAH